MNFFRRLCCGGFINWTENIKNKRTIIHYPKNDDEICELILLALKRNQKVRVAGSKHSQSPAVTNTAEPNLLLISLEKYKSDKDIFIDHDKMQVTVNAGWKLGQLADELNRHNYLLETQTAGSVFSIGGICSMPVHGSRLGASIISDYVTEITYIDDSCNKITKTEADDDFDYYRTNYGIYGVVTHLTLKIMAVNNISAKITNFYNIFYDIHVDGYKLKRSQLDEYFANVVAKCLEPDPNCPEYVQCFVDYYNNVFVVIEWKDDDEKYHVAKEYPDATKMYNLLTPEIYFSKLSKNFRSHLPTLKTGNQIARAAIMYNVEKNMQEDRDMFWISTALRSNFMSYFIPIYHEDIGLNLDNLYTSIEFVMNLNKIFVEKEATFNIDLPSDIRFVVSSQKSKLSPIYNEKKIVYAAVEIICTAYNIETDRRKINGITEHLINELYRQFFYQVEQKWLSLGGIPHIGKVFGFEKDTDPFQKSRIAKVLPESAKSIMRERFDTLFVNNFVTDLLTEIPDAEIPDAEAPAL